MVGNDIVDLGDPDADPSTLHPGFDARVFTARERRSIESAGDPARQRWRLWAAKEACYKLARQLRPDESRHVDPRWVDSNQHVQLRGDLHGGPVRLE